MNIDSHCHFPAFEFTSHTNKLKQLWLTGKEAKLEFETYEGQAWGSLHVCLGQHPSQPLLQRQFGDEKPANWQRREQWKAARLGQPAAVKAAANAIPEEAAVDANDAGDKNLCDEENVVITEEVATAHIWTIR